MNRRAFLCGLTLGTLSAPLAAEAQQAGKMYRIGLLGPVRAEQAEPYIAVFRHRMREHGWIEGKHFALEIRMAEGKPERLPDLAGELVRSKVAVIVAWSTPAITAAKNASATIPIVMASGADPVGAGLVTSLSRPGGSITGVSQLEGEVSRKYLQLVREVVPRLSRIGVLIDPSNRGDLITLGAIRATSKTMGLKAEAVGARNLAEIDSAFVSLKNHRVEAVIVSSSGVNYVNRKRIVELVAKSRLPALYGVADFAKDGGLMSYGADLLDLTRKAVDYVDKILKGAKPSDLPVEQPTKFELVINLKTAKALGLTIPQSLLIGADEVIE